MAGRQDGGLSSEQIQRMEENRRQAQQRLTNKRAAGSGSTSQVLHSSSMGSSTPFNSAAQHSQYGPPPAKRQAVIPTPSTHQYQPHERKIIGPPPKSIRSEYISSSQGQSSATAGSSVTIQRRPVDYTAASTSHQHPPQTSSGSSSLASSSSSGQVGTFNSRDRGAGPSTATRGTGAVSSALPSTSSQKVLNGTDCVWLFLGMCVSHGGWGEGR